MTDRLFTDDELQEMGKRTLDRLNQAIDDGDSARAKKIAQRMYNEFLSMHDLYRNWITATLSEIGTRYGDQALDEIMLEGVRAWWQPNVEKMPQGTDAAAIRAKIKMFAAGLQGHLQPLEITEDDEKFEIKMCPCGSGGRLISEGHYEGENAFLKIKDGQAMTYGRADYPVYCAHEYAMEKINIEASGAPLGVVEPAQKLGRDYCSLLVYKDPAAVPARYYERIGLKKP